MPTLIPYRYSDDFTGNNPDNLVIGEARQLQIKKYRTIEPTHSPFYAQSLKIKDQKTGAELKRNVHYVCIDICSIPTIKSTLEVFSKFVIIDTTISENIIFDYQTAGSRFHANYTGISDLLDNLLNDKRPVEYENIQNRPTEFDPIIHRENVADAFGFEYLISALERVRQSILYGDTIGHSNLIKYIEARTIALENVIKNKNDSVLANAIIDAKNAKVSASGALNAIVELQNEVANLENMITVAYNNISQLASKEINAEAIASSLLSNYAGALFSNESGTFKSPPSLAQPTPLAFPLNEAAGLVSEDIYAITNQGTSISNLTTMSLNAMNQQSIAFVIKFSLYKQIGTGLALINLIVESKDNRNPDLSGTYTDQCKLSLYPIEIGNIGIDKLSVYCHSSWRDTTQNPKDNIVRQFLYQIEGSINPAATLDDNALQIINSNLLDIRNDFNVKNYGGLIDRKNVTLSIPIGGKINFNFYLSGTNINDIRQMFMLKFKHSFVIRNSLGILVDKPESNRVRCLSGFFA